MIIFAELIFANDSSKNHKFRGIHFRDFTIGSEIRGIYFRDWLSGRKFLKQMDKKKYKQIIKTKIKSKSRNCWTPPTKYIYGQ